MINSLTNLNPRMHRLLPLPFYVLGALFIGLAVPYAPLLSIVMICGFVLCVFAYLYPDQMSILMLIISVVSYQLLFQTEVFGMDPQALNKLGILAFAIPAMLRFGINVRFVWPIIALFVLVVITFTLSNRHPLLEGLDPIRACIGLAAPLSLLLIRLSPAAAEKQLRTITLLPLISLAVGSILHLTGKHMLYVLEFNGAFRLQGANIPAHLAFLAFIAFIVCMVEWKRKPEAATWCYIMMVINFVILILTGTRGPLIALIPLLILFVFDLSKQFTNGKTRYLVPLFGSFAVIAVSVVLQLDNFMKRTFERQTATGFDLSGRVEAWDFFLSGVKEAPWFGRGLGSVLVANDGSIYGGFVVPHNEYIRFYFDSGFIGAALLFSSLFIVFGYVYRSVAANVKPYFLLCALGFFIYSFSDNTMSTIQFLLPFCAFLCALTSLSERKRTI